MKQNTNLIIRIDSELSEALRLHNYETRLTSSRTVKTLLSDHLKSLNYLDKSYQITDLREKEGKK